MVDFGEKILKNLDIILSKINTSVKIINDIKSIEIIKSESLSLSKMIYSTEGELLLLSQYVKDFYKFSPPISVLNEEFITTKEKVNNHGFSDKILGAWSKYRQHNDKLSEEEVNIDYLDRLESNFSPLIFKNTEVIKFFNEEINSVKTIYNKYNRKLGQVYSDDFIAEDGVFDTSGTEILYRIAKPKFDSILFDAFAFIDLILFEGREVLYEEEIQNENIFNEVSLTELVYDKEAQEIFTTNYSFNLFLYLAESYAIQDRPYFYSDIYYFMSKTSHEQRDINDSSGKKYRNYIIKYFNLKSYAKLDKRESIHWLARLNEDKKKFKYSIGER